jgi:hypothetical protein
MFLLKDMSGRDAVAKVNAQHLLEHYGTEENNNGMFVQEWVKTARMGDDFSVHSTIIICIADGGR